MQDQVNRRVSYVTGPDGQVLTQASLPKAGTRRWVARRKAEVITAVRGGLLDMTEACARYEISTEEFIAWDRAYESSGLAGLRACLSRHAPASEHAIAQPSNTGQGVVTVRA